MAHTDESTLGVPCDQKARPTLKCADSPKALRDERGVILGPGALLVDASGDRNVGTGSDLFAYVFDNGVFVDKSLLIRDVLQGFQAKLFCRPRRFGKTLATTMLQDFFECAPCADAFARERFSRLGIWEADGGRWREHQARYPVIALSLKGVEADTWDGTLARLGELMARECRRHAYLREAPSLDSADLAWFERVRNQQADSVDLVGFLRNLSGMLSAYHGEPCMILIDEYDAPINHAHTRGFYDEAVLFLRSWLSGGLKTNPALARGVLTGVQRISKESIFSGLNNIQVNTALNQASDERFGFTQQEVDMLAAYIGVSDKTSEIATWYDGYRFGSASIYNPWSVLSYFAAGCVAQPYWTSTSSNGVLAQALGRVTSTTDQLLALLEPDSAVHRPVDSNVSYGELDRDPAGIWSVLYMSGYLTTDDTASPEDPSLVRALRVPNAEVRAVFRREVVDRAHRAAEDPSRLRVLHDALVEGDAFLFERALGSIAAGSASYYDLTSEAACHMLLMGLLFGVPGYRNPVSNREAGFGRFDLQLTPKVADLPLITVELKFMPVQAYRDLGEQAERALRNLSEEALAQIDRQGYDAVDSLADEGGTCLRWGVAFGGKHVSAACASLGCVCP